MTPRAVAFDLMDTVLRDPFREALEAAVGLPLGEIMAARDPEAYPRLERAEISEDEYWACYTDAGLEVDVDAFHAARRAGYVWLTGMRELLDDLADRVLRVAASNYPYWVEELTGGGGLLAGRFEQVWASCHLGARKPEPEFYRRLLGALGLPPAAVVFVDDREVNVEAARAAGLRGVRFEDADTLRASLEAAGVPVRAGR